MLFEQLSTCGEPLTNTELHAVLTSLLGGAGNNAGQVQKLPSMLSARLFSSSLLGFTDTGVGSDKGGLKQSLTQYDDNGDADSDIFSEVIDHDVTEDDDEEEDEEIYGEVYAIDKDVQ
uniref:Heat-inducible transcription repressor HrcA n=1 Tax=Lygus hesperus TaxID=30085 RepID=A0A0A9Z3E1_LYGHE